MKASEGEAKSEDVAAGLENLTISNNKSDTATEHVEEEEEDLWNPPPRPDCPICMLPLPLSPTDSAYWNCCGKILCYGCIIDNERAIEKTNARNARRNRDRGIPPLEVTCPFCREPMPDDDKVLLRLENRMKLNDGDAFFNLAGLYTHGEVVAKSERKAFELCLRAADLGNADACHLLSEYYRIGRVVERNAEKCRKYLEMAAKQGNVFSRHHLGFMEKENGNMELAIKHWLISASAGLQGSLTNVKLGFRDGFVSKDQYLQALRLFQTATNELSSEGRDRWAVKKAKCGGRYYS